jgi:hypothetical protein
MGDQGAWAQFGPEQLATHRMQWAVVHACRRINPPGLAAQAD